jgi:hypothetical protein
MLCHVTWSTVMTFQKSRVPPTLGSNLPDAEDVGTTLPWNDDNHFPVNALYVLEVLKCYHSCNNTKSHILSYYSPVLCYFVHPLYMAPFVSAFCICTVKGHICLPQSVYSRHNCHIQQCWVALFYICIINANVSFIPQLSSVNSCFKPLQM